MSASSRYLAFFAYLLSLPGALYVLLARRDDAFAVYHARQSLALALAALLTPLIWLIAAFALAWIPTAGPVAGVALFALVLAAYVGFALSWVIGMVYALQGRVRAIPLVGRPATRQKRQTNPEPEVAVEPVEATLQR
jgi:uncharacterized membrane protein